MRIVMFYHSLISDWNHGNAHFLRGIACELLARGHDVAIYEPCDGWSLRNLLANEGRAAVEGFHAAYPGLTSEYYDPARADLDEIFEGADLALVHESTEPELVRRIGEHRARVRSFRLLFHDTHHRCASAPEEMARYDLRHFDGVLAFGKVLRETYLRRGFAAHAWTWHEAADTSRFFPRYGASDEGDLVFIGNWGDGERARELAEFLFEPIAKLRLSASIYGVRYPDAALAALEASGARYRGWLPNYAAPEVFARHSVTVHVTRRAYVDALPGIPTIRVFEALACGIPLISAPWRDTENLFEPGRDFLMVETGAQMQSAVRAVLNDAALACDLTTNGLQTIHRRHSCARRVDELFEICRELEGDCRAA